MKLSSLKRDSRTLSGEGVWITPVAGENGRLRVLGSTPRYKLRRDQAIKRLVRQYGSWEEVPPGIRAREMAKITFEELVLEVKGFEGAEGEASRDELLALASTAEGEPALDLVYAAIDMATARREADADDAEGNSERSSSGIEETSAPRPSSPEATPTT